MTGALPGLAVILGIAGLIPFLVCGLGAISLMPESAARMLAALVAYGAVILAFLGGVHWGFALSPLPVQVAQAEPDGTAIRPRLALGVVPPLLGWAALLLPLALPAEFGLAALIVGFVLLAVAESHGRRRGLVPAGYMMLRWGLSVVVVALLVTVLVLRLLGARVIL